MGAEAVPAGAELGGLAGWAVDLMDTVGGAGAGLAVAAENLFPPIPSEVILPLAGFTAAQGRFSVVGAIAWTTLGSVVGALALYGLGAWLGRERLVRLADRLPLFDASDVDKADAWFARYGGRAVLFGRMVPIVRSLVSIPAGVQRMPIALFTGYTLLGSLLWNTIFVVAGYQLGSQWHVVEEYAAIVEIIVILGASVLLAVWLRRKMRERRRSAQG